MRTPGDDRDTAGPGPVDDGLTSDRVEIISSEPDRVAWAATDVLRLAVAVVSLLVVMVVGALFGQSVVRFVAKLVSGIETLPSWLVTGVVLFGQILGVVVIVGGTAVALLHRRWTLLVVAAGAAATAVLLTLLIRPLVDRFTAHVAQVDTSYTLVAPDRVASVVGLTILTAVVTAAAPWVGRRQRRAAWTLVLISMFTRLLGAPIGFDTMVAFFAGWTAGAAAIVVLGAPSRRPTGRSIADGLASVGIPLSRLEQASLDARGSTPYFAVGRDGQALFVKALGADERSADLLFRLYRRFRRRDLGDERPFSSLRRAVEHEALVALTARDLGIRTPRLVAFATAAPNGFVLAYEAIAGRSLDRLDPVDLTDALLAATWAELVRLRSHHIAHRDLRLANMFRADDGTVWIIDFGFSELAASDRLLATDVAELLASSATQTGAERAVAAGVAAVGPDAIVRARDRLRLAVLSGATRSAMKAEPRLLDDLRQCAASIAGER